MNILELLMWLLLTLASDVGLPVSMVTANGLQGDALRGEVIFRQGINGAPACMGCHALAAGGFGLGPAMAGVKARAAERVAGLSAEQYIHESILKPGAYIVPGFRDLMFADYARYLNQQDIADLQAYLTGLSP